MTYTKKLAAGIAAAQNHGASQPADWRGNWLTPPLSAPTATRVEGLLAAYRLLTAGHVSVDAALALSTSRSATAFQLATQIGPEAALYLPNPQRALGGFRAALDRSYVRIDFVQHNVSALLDLLEILPSK